MFTLKEFLKTSLQEIMEALTEFADDEANGGATPFPELSGHSKDLGDIGLVKASWDDDKQVFPTIMPITFDIAVTAAEEKEKGGGGQAEARIAVVSLKAGGDAKATETNSKVSRINFRVPLQLPVIHKPAGEKTPKGFEGGKDPYAMK